MYDFFSKLYKGILKLLFFPTVIANLFHALTMDENGYSLKKIGFVFATAEAAKMSHEIINKPQFDMGTGKWIIAFWLIYGGILVGIYSFGDITDGLSKVKGTKSEDKPVEPKA